MTRRPLTALLCAAGGLLGLACAAERAPEERSRPAVTWLRDVQPEVAAACVSCHSGASPAGSYDLGTYAGTLGPGSDSRPNAVAGDATSTLLVAALAPTHPQLPEVMGLLRRWVLASELAYFDSGVHAPGFLNPADPTFHGTELRATGYRVEGCKGCHGAVLEGRGPATACAACHTGGPQTCGTCHGHGAPDDPRPATGAHAAHERGGEGGRPVPCRTCHVVPATLDDPGHYDADDGRGDVTFSGLATRGGHTPRYDAVARSCSDTYCHGSATPEWTAPTGGAACGTCHALPPPAPHPADPRCEACHSAVAGPGQTIARREWHVDGSVRLAATEGCSGCHGDATSPAPDTGAHRLHVGGGPLGVVVRCDECHRVPTTPTDPGHLDPPPAELELHGRAAGARPEGATGPDGWDPGTRTCGVACHGLARPAWDTPAPGATCGSCHAAPPALGHFPGDPCARCHDPAGHLDGRFTLALPADVPACAACHGDATSLAPDRGAHRAHEARGYGCVTCHSVPAAVADPGHVDTPLPAEVTLGGALATARGHRPAWDPQTRTCGGTYCHADAVPAWDAPRGEGAPCGSCHALPPAPHARFGVGAGADCRLCHGSIYRADDTLDPARHPNGALDGP